MVTLFKDKKYFSAVVYGEGLDGTDKNAVYEYCRFMRFCVRKNQPAYSHLPKDYTSYVFIGGNNPLAKSLGISVPYEKFEEDTVYIAIKDNYVLLDGGVRGKLYAVYEFLERFMGVRFYAPERYKTPRSTEVVLEECEILYTPPIKYRETYSPDIRFNNQFSARVRSNSEEYVMALGNYGGGLKWAEPKSHTTFGKLFAPEDEETGFEKHPEYYSFRKNLNRRVGRHHYELGCLWGEGDLCWTNPTVVDIITERMKKWILNEREKEIFSISQNDWGEYCECENCEKNAVKYGRKLGPAWNASMVLGVNEIARRIKEWQKTDERVKDRKILVETFAYDYSTMPPKGIVLEDNVLIRFCTHVNCFYHAFRDKNCPINKVYATALERWGKAAKQIYIWDYTANHTFYEAFNTNLRHLQDNIQFFAENHAIGVFEEFQDFEHTGLYSEVRQYMIARLLWNPYIDYEAELRECVEFFYEDTAPYILEIERKYYENTDKIKDFHPKISRTILKEEFPEEFLDAVSQLFELALKKAKHEAVRLRIKRDYVCVKLIKMYLNRENDLVEAQRVLDEMEDLEVPFIQGSRFVAHYFGGEKNDLFLKEIEERNCRRQIENVKKHEEMCKLLDED